VNDRAHHRVLVAERHEGRRTLIADAEQAVYEDGDLRAGRERFELAYQRAQRAADVGGMAAAAVGLGGLWVHEDRSAAGPVRLGARLHHALSLLNPQSALALRIRARLAGESDYRSGGHEAIIAVLDEATRRGQPVARAEALSMAHHCLLGPQHGARRRELAVALIEESFRTRRRSDLLMGMLWQTVDLLLDADPHAGRRLTELREQLARRDHLAVGFVVSAIEVMLAIRAGRLDRAESLSELCARRGAAAGDIDAEFWYRAQLMTVRWYQGRLVELLPLLDVMVNSPTLSVVDNSCRAALAVAAALAGDEPKAAAELAALCGGDLADLPRSSTWLVTMHGIVQAAHLLEDADTALRAYELLLPYARLPMVGGLGVVCFGSTQHALGLALLTAGDLDGAVEHLRAAVQQNLALAHWPAVVASRHKLAQALARRGQPHDASRARAESAAAAREGAALGLAVSGDAAYKTPAKPVTCIRQGRDWRVEAGGRGIEVGHSVGMLHLAVLIANPGQEIPAAELVAGLAALARDAERAAESEQPLLDEEAVREYRDRVEALNAEIGELESGGEPERAAPARAEREWLVAELARNTGIGGRARSFPDGAERARIAVGKAIRRAVARIAESDPAIGEQLRQTVHTGVRCSYRPV
jgi:hypothetical protein